MRGGFGPLQSSLKRLRQNCIALYQQSILIQIINNINYLRSVLQISKIFNIKLIIQYLHYYIQNLQTLNTPLRKEHNLSLD